MTRGSMKNYQRAILYVEDNPDDVFFMRRALAEANVENPVHHLGSGREAIEYLGGHGAYADRSRFPFPALVLLDLQLPQGNGLDVLRWIRSRPEFDSLLVIVLTSSAHPRDVDTAYTLGARSYLVKPNTPEDLKLLVESWKMYWIGHNQFPLRKE